MEFLTAMCESLTMVSRFPGYYNESMNYHSEAVEIPGHQFKFIYTSVDPGVGTDDINNKLPTQRDVWAELNSLGFAGTFTWILPIHSQRLGVGGGSPTANGAKQSGTKQIAFENADPNVLKWLKKGDIFRWANHTKLYLVAKDVDTDGAGRGLITTVNPLQVYQPDGSEIIIDNVEATLRVKPDGNETTYEYGREAGNLDMVAFTKEFIEAF